MKTTLLFLAYASCATFLELGISWAQGIAAVIAIAVIAFIVYVCILWKMFSEEEK